MGEQEEAEGRPADAALRLSHARQRLRQMAASAQSLLEKCNVSDESKSLILWTA